MLDYLRETLQSRSRIERVLWTFLLLFVFSISFSIAVTHIFLTCTTIVYLYWKLRFDRTLPRVPVLIPAIGFAYCVLISSVFSIHPSLSIVDSKDLALFIIIPICYDVVRDLHDIRVIYGILIFAGVVSAAYGVYQFFGAESDLINSRIRGFMGHWMTFSGLLMVLNVLLLSHLLFSREHPKWFYPAFVLLSVSLLLSLTRNAWIGFLAAATVLIALRQIRWIIAVPAMVLIVCLVSVLVFPSVVADRMSSIFNPNETSNRDRLQMLRSGWRIIQDYPLTGVGSGMIPQVYPRYREPDSVFRNNQHLHNNLLQLTAENGVLALLVWLWFVAKTLMDLIHWKRNVMNPEERFLIHGTIGIVVSLVVAGMFEYNFGDSEIKMLFLVLISLPYAWHKALEASNGVTDRVERSPVPEPATAS